MTNIIELNQVSVKFQQQGQDVFAVKEASLQIEKGDIYGIIGYSGAGKSTLVRTINLLQQPTTGQIIVNGQTIFDRPDEESPAKTLISGKDLRNFRQKVGMIFQHFNLLSEKTVYANVAFALAHTTRKDEKNGKSITRFLTDKEKHEKVAKLLELVHLSDLAEQYPAQLSGGQKQRVAIARALANDPEILISDEGTSALDPKTTNQILDLLKQLHETLGLTIVFITHEMAVVKEIANKVAVIQDGEIIEKNTLVDIFSAPQKELTKQFIETTSASHRFIENIAQTNILSKLADDEELIQLSFEGRESSVPIISAISKNYAVTASIFFGNVELLQDVPFGSLIIVLKGEKSAREAAKDYLGTQTVKFAVIKDLKEVE